MPNLIERARMRLADVLLGDEKQKLQEVFGVMRQAYLDGPWALPPEALVKQLTELDPFLLQDYLQQMGWDVIGGYGLPSTAERTRAIQESRRLYKYSPMGQWAIWLWTSWGLGESVQVTIDVEEADLEWQEFWEADRNQSVLGADCIHEMSNWLLVDGNQFLAFYGSTVDGETTVTEINPDEITEIVPDPDNAARPLFYKREWTDAKSGKANTLYYPDWQIYLSGEADEAAPGNDDKTLAQVVLPLTARRADTGQLVSELAEANDVPRTTVCLMHLAYNHKERGELWGWPLLATAASWLKAHKRFLEARLAVAEAKAAFVRRYRVQGGSRAVASIKATIASKLTSTSSSYDTNPPPAPASSEFMNQAVEAEDLPMSTGAGDADADNKIFTWHAALAAGLNTTSVGLDAQRYATALAMDRTQSIAFARYKAFWGAQFRKMARIVIGNKERYGNQSFGEWTADVSIDSFSLADFPDVARTIGSLVSSSLTPLVLGGVIPAPAAKAISAALWRVNLQALGVANAGEMTSDEAFGVVEEPEVGAVPEAPVPEEPAGPGEPEAAGKEEAPGGGTVEEVLMAAIENWRAGSITAGQLAELAIAEWAEAVEQQDA